MQAGKFFKVYIITDAEEIVICKTEFYIQPYVNKF